MLLALLVATGVLGTPAVNKPRHPGIDVDIVAPWTKAVAERAKQSFPDVPKVRDGRLDRALVARAAAQLEQAMAAKSADAASQAEAQLDSIYQDWAERQQRAFSEFADQVKARAAFEQLILQRLQLQAAEDEALLLVLANE